MVDGRCGFRPHEINLRVTSQGGPSDDYRGIVAWLQLSIVTDQAQIACVSKLLSEVGALAVTCRGVADEPLFESAPGETPLWAVARLTGLFRTHREVEHALQALDARLGPEALRGPVVETLEDKDWEREWIQWSRPLRFGNRLCVTPSWCQSPTAADAVNVVLDPGLAFGTGTHASTELCLEWLAGARLCGVEIIDYGCGSGILAIAGVKLGARHAYAVDTDARAIQATMDNARRNHVLAAIEAILPGALPAVQAEVVVANILANPLITLAPRLASLVAWEGHIVLSGILADQAPAIGKAYAPWFDMDAPVLRGEWVRLVGKRVRRPGD